MTDDNGDAVENTFYLPFGEVTGGQAGRYSYTGKEYDPAVGSFDFLARRYSPEYGRFAQPDVVMQDIYDPQTLNHYSYVRNNPYRYIDPTGRYDEDVHRDLTYYLATEAGFSADEARVIAQANYNVDDLLSGDRFGQIHFLSREEAESRVEAAIKSHDLRKFGEALHAYQDSFSHGEIVQAVVTSSSWGLGEMFGVGLRHSFTFTNPDKTHVDVEKANEMGEGTFGYVAQMREQTGGQVKKDYSQIEGTVTRFSKEESPSAKKDILNVPRSSTTTITTTNKFVWWNPFTWGNVFKKR